MGTETEEKNEETQEPKATGIDILDGLEGDSPFAKEEDFGELDDENEKPEEDSSASAEDTPGSATGGQDDGTSGDDKPEEEPPGKEKSQEEPPAKKKPEDEKPPAEGDDKPPATVPYGRFAEVVGDRNELREKFANLSGRFDAMEKAAVEKAKTDSEKPEEEPEDLDDPITLTKRELREQIKTEAGKLTPEPDDSLRQEVRTMNLRMSERDARADHKDYDEVVYESGFFRELELAAKEGSEDAKETIREIFSSENPAAEMYSFACDVQGKTPPDVKDLNPDDWGQVEPVLEKLGLKTTEDKWKSRRGKPKQKPPEKKEKGQEEEAPESDDDETLRSVPSGAEPAKGAADDGEIDLDKTDIFQM